MGSLLIIFNHYRPLRMRFKNLVMYYLKIGKMWVSDVGEDQCLMSENMLNGWTYEQDAVSDAKIAARLTGMDVLLLKLEVIRSVEAD